MSERKTSPCRGCGKPIVWADDGHGGKLPLDPRPPVYAVAYDAAGNAQATRHVTAMVTHFATCPKANDFSASRKK